MDPNELSRLKPKRILLCQLRQIGDVVLLTTSIAMLRRRYPKAEIHVLTEDRCAPVLDNHPDVAHVWRLDKRAGFFESLAFYRRVGRAGFDLVVDFQQLPRCRWVMAFCDATVRLTFPPPWYNRPFYTHWAQVSGPYAAKCKAGVLMNGLNLPWVGDLPRMYLSGAEREWAERFLAERGVGPGEIVVTLDPTHRRATRRWPAKHYGRLVDLTVAARPDVRFVALHGPGEEDMAREVLAATLRRDCCILIEEPTLRRAAALIGRAALHVGNCSAPRHFAAALDTPSLTILGSSSNAWTCPDPRHEDVALGLDCQPCNGESCVQAGTEIPCLAGLAPQRVVERLLARLPAAEAPAVARVG